LITFEMTGSVNSKAENPKSETKTACSAIGVPSQCRFRNKITTTIATEQAPFQRSHPGNPKVWIRKLENEYSSEPPRLKPITVVTASRAFEAAATPARRRAIGRNE
jgi:hypothetical protein